MATMWASPDLSPLETTMRLSISSPLFANMYRRQALNSYPSDDKEYASLRTRMALARIETGTLILQPQRITCEHIILC